MRKLAALVAGVTATFAMTGSAPAQTGEAALDGNRHPNVGALLAKRTDGSLGIICSGTLVSSRVFLTAGHCADFMFSLGQFDAFVTFDPNFGTDPLHNIFSTPYHGTLVQNPDFHVPAQNDTALVLLDKAVKIAPAKIAPLGFLDGLRDAGTIQTTKFTNVGYGTAEQVVVPGTGPIYPGDGIRKYTISGFYSLTPEYIHLNQNLKQGYSGTCFGDSGGPTFVSSAAGPGRHLRRVFRRQPVLHAERGRASRHRQRAAIPGPVPRPSLAPGHSKRSLGDVTGGAPASL